MINRRTYARVLNEIMYEHGFTPEKKHPQFYRGVYVRRYKKLLGGKKLSVSVAATDLELNSLKAEDLRTCFGLRVELMLSRSFSNVDIPNTTNAAR